jgi:hypothetical protein
MNYALHAIDTFQAPRHLARVRTAHLFRLRGAHGSQ